MSVRPRTGKGFELLSHLLDTNTCIYIRRQRPPGIAERFRMLPAGQAAISVITYGELAYGTEKIGRQNFALRGLQELFRIVPVLALPERAGETYGAIRARLEGRGEVISGNDLWIAAHALAAGLILVTNNEREFRRVPGLQLENWAAPT